MLTGELPAKPPEAPSRKVQVEVRLDEIVLRALEASPERRYQTVTDFREQVETIAVPGSPHRAQAGASPPSKMWAPAFAVIVTFAAHFLVALSLARAYPGQSAGPVIVMMLCAIFFTICAFELAGVWPFSISVFPDPQFGSRNLRHRKSTPNATMNTDNTMNEDNSGAGPIEPNPITYKDRSTGLRVFGVLTILIGCRSGLIAPLMLLGNAMSTRSGAVAIPMSSMLPSALMYCGLSVALVWLGIGSIAARRWARALLLIFSWSWLIMGLLSLVLMSFFAQQMHASAPSAGVIVVMFTILGGMFIVLPGIWAWFYGSRDAKATCETRDPVRRWTDACPLPVLGFSLWLAFSALMMLITPIASHGVMPFFGAFITGLPGTIFSATVAILWVYCARSLYKLEPLGWWLIFIAMCVFSASALVTFARHDPAEMYSLMHYSNAQIGQLQKTSGLFGSRMSMTWMMAASMLPFLGYLLFIRKYIRFQPGKMG
jgi:hypothetical protein